ncbi:MAG: glycosyltransferase family 39 protein [Deltaproteobacteria bacterium]|nr:glycosyltransferase family 39 protein [Deltaproteobacteria bacterium]MBW2309175.1 glycosyltransferase family 39 protein [Deltaproteobacteria bacterium]
MARALFNAVYVQWGPMDLFPDEAHYWEWSRNLDWSYYSKGPMVAYIIALFTRSLGHTTLTVRSGAIVLSVLTGLTLYAAARRITGSHRHAFWACLALSITPLGSAGSFIMTIDAPFIFFWVLGLYTAWRAVEEDAPRWWSLSGFVVGLGMLSKYTMVFFWPSLFLYLALSPKKRALLKNRWLYGALLLSAVVFIPVLLWNAEHDWMSFRHLWSQTRGRTLWGGLTLRYFIEFLGSQMLVISPLIFAGMMYAMVRATRRPIDEGNLFCLCFALVTLGCYFLKSFQGKTQANWAASAYPSAIILTVRVFGEKLRHAGPGSVFGRRVRRWIIAAAALCLMLSITGYSLFYLRAVGIPIPPSRDPANRAYGWAELGEQVGKIYHEMGGHERVFLLSDRYQEASELAFYVPGHPRVFNVNLGRRLNQYDLWQPVSTQQGKDALVLRRGNRSLKSKLKDLFRTCRPKATISIKRYGQTLKQFRLFHCEDYSGRMYAPVEVSY